MHNTVALEIQRSVAFHNRLRRLAEQEGIGSNSLNTTAEEPSALETETLLLEQARFWVFSPKCLAPFLQRHAISAYRVVKETSGQLAPNTVCDLARKPARRIDLRTVSKVVNALERITGSPVTINDLLERVPEAEEGETVPLEPVDLTDLIAAAAKDAKSSKPLGSRHPVTVRGPGPTIVQIIREGRR